MQKLRYVAYFSPGGDKQQLGHSLIQCVNHAIAEARRSILAVRHLSHHPSSTCVLRAFPMWREANLGSFAYYFNQAAYPCATS